MEKNGRCLSQSLRWTGFCAAAQMSIPNREQKKIVICSVCPTLYDGLPKPIMQPLPQRRLSRRVWIITLLSFVFFR